MRSRASVVAAGAMAVSSLIVAGTPPAHARDQGSSEAERTARRISVDTSAELTRALRRARPGDVIRLADGVYTTDGDAGRPGHRRQAVLRHLRHRELGHRPPPDRHPRQPPRGHRRQAGRRRHRHAVRPLRRRRRPREGQGADRAQRVQGDRRRPVRPPGAAAGSRQADRSGRHPPARLLQPRADQELPRPPHRRRQRDVRRGHLRRQRQLQLGDLQRRPARRLERRADPGQHASGRPAPRASTSRRGPGAA